MANWKNVGNWHWTDKNCIKWAQTYFKDRLANVAVSHDGFNVTTEDVTSVTGDCDLNQRKGKIITIYDVEIKLNWSGTAPDGTEASGTIHIPEVAHDTESEDFVFDVTVVAETPAKRAIKEVVRKQLAAALRERLGGFRADLIEAHRKDVYIEPDQLGVPARGGPIPALSSASAPKAEPATAAATTTTTPAPVTNTVTLDETIEFVTNAAELYTTLTDPARIALWTRARPQFEARVGGHFALFDGNVTGEVRALDPDRHLELTWRLASWPSGHYSRVVMDLDQGDASVRLHLVQTGIPVGELDQTKRNWHQYYWQSIKGTFG
ncbi:Co-chaperone [Tieghemiomyces parasiticus]|uniref:Co-chaperone n=1 Tax=Tieghemiomyces parasiticus TaxID=78921 RepID=A0A9W8DP02_9FUNG|nr:Co-chaperone [Tieghemiomyces parasiticus]